MIDLLKVLQTIFLVAIFTMTGFIYTEIKNFEPTIEDKAHYMIRDYNKCEFNACRNYEAERLNALANDFCEDKECFNYIYSVIEDRD